MKIQGNQFLSIEQLQHQYLGASRQKTQEAGAQAPSFQDILSGKTDGISKEGEVKFSKHAANRLIDRKIESLVIVDSLAFIVNVPNQTVITAMEQTETNENVFTNIDGAVII